MSTTTSTASPSLSFSGEKISKLLGIDEEFKGQKSVRMLIRILEATTNDGDLVLDFFCGTASTAHAVMQLNAKEGEQRRHIMVQLPEATELGSAARKAGFVNLAALARRRIDVAGSRIRTAGSVADFDSGYRTLRIDSTNLADVVRTPDATDQHMLTGLEASVKPGPTGEDLLFQVLLDWGLELSLPIRVEQVDGREVFDVDEGALLACFDPEVSPALVRELARREPLRVVFLDSGFASDAARINAEQIFRELSASTDVRTI